MDPVFILLGVIAGAAFSMGYVTGWIARPRPPPQPIDPILCTDEICEAFRSDACSDGRCRYHCQLYCKCESSVEAVTSAALRKARPR